ncbi:MAG: CPBP family intramembrane metalloprotease [Gammaproteobacteria bacterium]|nr:CPBP family intramembrane metalloprotease [Gammaproteobacteria bacterium]
MFDGKLTLTRIMVAYLIAKLAQSLLFEVYDTPLLYPVSLLGVLVLFLGLVNLLCYPNTVPLKNLLIRNNDPVRLNTVIGLMILIALYKYGSAVIYFAYNDLLNQSNQPAIDELKQLASKNLNEQLDVLFITKVTIAPLVEEVVYRVVLLGYMVTRYRANVAIIISALIFGIFHGIDGFFMSFVGGIFLSYVYIKFRNIWLCIGLHAFINLFVLLTPGVVLETLVVSTQTTHDLIITFINSACAILTTVVAAYALTTFNHKQSLFGLQNIKTEQS